MTTKRTHPSVLPPKCTPKSGWRTPYAQEVGGLRGLRGYEGRPLGRGGQGSHHPRMWGFKATPYSRLFPGG